MWEDEETVWDSEQKLSNVQLRRVRLVRDHHTSAFPAYLCENQFVQQYVLLHIRDGDGRHYQQRTHHHPLTPGLHHQPIWVRRTRDFI